VISKLNEGFQGGGHFLAAEFLRKEFAIARHDIALTLGSGWAKSIDLIGVCDFEISAKKVPGFSTSTVSGHLGTIKSLTLANGKKALVLGARTHLYEGKGVAAVAHSVRVAAACGAKIMILTNGAGGIKEGWQPGTPVLISDHINLTGESPLEGATFVDLTDLYSQRLRAIARSVDPSLDEGIYVQFRGPHYETPAEVQMAKAMGGHIVGMSTAIEAIAAREAGMEVLGMSLITNLAAGISPHPLSHQEVIDAGKAAEMKISHLLASIVEKL
jgi:purine-nucleoside phosphorylase